MKTPSLIVVPLFLAISAASTWLQAATVEPLPDASLLAKNPNTAKANNQQKQQTPPKTVDITLTGTIDSIAPNFSGLTMTAKKSPKAKPKTWTVGLDAGTRVIINGTATASYLKGGQNVELSGTIDEHGKLTEKVKKLTVIAPALSAKGVGANARAANPGIGGERITPPKGLGIDADAKADPTKNMPAETGEAKKIVGKFSKVNENELTVAFGKKSIQAELAEDATINVLLSDFKLAKTGSQIIVHGNGAETKNGAMVLAKEITVTLTEPLTGKKAAAVGKKAPAGK